MNPNTRLPLRPLHDDDAALVFASGSHRDFSLPYWHSLEGMADLSGREYEVREGGGWGAGADGVVVHDLGCRVWGKGCRMWGSGLRFKTVLTYKPEAWNPKHLILYIAPQN
jgi:hypothetical protein